jgi:hypothetical protein
LGQLKGAAEENDVLKKSLTTTKTQLHRKFEEISVKSAKILPVISAHFSSIQYEEL